MTQTNAAQAANLAEFFDCVFAGVRPSKIVLVTAVSLLGFSIVWNLLTPGNLFKRADATKWRVLRTLLAPIIKKEIDKAAADIKFKHAEGDRHFNALPKESMTQDEIFAIGSKRKLLDHSFKDGEMSGTIYHGGEEHTQFMNKICEMFQWSNPLHIDCFIGIRKIEAEVAAMAVSMYHGEAAKSGTACGTVTSGGSESICQAMRASREYARHTRGLTTFSFVAPQTIHPAFDKAADYFNMRLIKVPINQETGAVEAAEMEKYIAHDTIVLVGSAPCFPNGCIDPIADIAALAKKHGLLMHVDACLGGFIMPFLHDAGFTDAPIVDFRVDGVTSISCDTHKYGFTLKGTSTVLYHSAELRRFQYFATADWPGGMYGSPGAPGSKPGQIIAATWACMLSFGHDGYVDTTRRIVNTRIKITEGLKKIPNVRPIGQPNASTLGLTSDAVDIFELNALLVKRGWVFNSLQFPSGLQFSVTLLHTKEGVAERLLKDVAECEAELEAKLAPGTVKHAEQGSSMYGSQQRIADRTIVSDVVRCVFDAYYKVDASQ